MKIQVNTDRNVDGGEALVELVEAEVHDRDGSASLTV